MERVVEGMAFTAEVNAGGLALSGGPNGLYLGGSRALLYSHVANEMLRRQLFHQVGDDLARAILAQAGRQAGFNDAQLLLQERSFDRLEEMLEAQYTMLAAGGFGRFELVELVVNKAAREVYARARCHGSPEAESHLRLFRTSDRPACCHLVGYSTGWSSAMTGLQVLTIETHCVAKGDDHCEVETLPYGDFVGPQASFWKRVFENTGTSLTQELTEKLTTIERQMETIAAQQQEIAQLSTPILQISEGLLVLPIIGLLDPQRVSSMSEKLLTEVVQSRARGVIIDVTGVAQLDTTTADHLARMVSAIRLIGAQAVMTGISPAMSQVLVSLGIDLRAIRTLRTLHDGMRYLQSETDVTAERSLVAI